MSTSREFIAFLQEQCPPEVSFRAMMGEYVLYYRDRVAGGVYDERVLVKPVPAALALIPEPRYELPYPGAKELLAVDEVDDREFLARLFPAMYDQLPPPKPKKPRSPRA